MRLHRPGARSSGTGTRSACSSGTPHRSRCRRHGSRHTRGQGSPPDMRTSGTPVERQVQQPVAGLHGPGPLRREMGAGVAQLEGADPCRIESLAEIASMGHVTGPGSHADDCRNAPRARETVVIK